MKINPRIAGVMAALIVFGIFLFRLQEAPDPDVQQDQAPAAEVADLPDFRPAAAGGSNLSPVLLELKGSSASLSLSPETGGLLSARLELPDHVGGGEYDMPLETPGLPWIRVEGVRVPLKGTPAVEKDGNALVLTNSWTGSDGTAMSLKRRFSSGPSDYLFDVDLSFGPLEGSGKPMPAVTEVGIPLAGGEGRSFVIWARRGGKSYPAFRDDELRTHGIAKWAALEERHYTIVAIPEEPGVGSPVTYIRGEGMGTGAASTPKDEDVEAEPFTGAVSRACTLYIGPRSDPVLTTLERDSSPLGESGKGLRTLVYPKGPLKPVMTLFASLVRQLQSRLVGDFGIAIILLAVFAKITFITFSRRSIISSAAMRRIQPEVASIRSDSRIAPSSKQARISELYRVNKVKPLFGIVNLIIHLFIFVAVSRIFTDLFDFSGAASRVLGIADLSRPDSLYHFSGRLPLLGWTELSLLPILVLIASFVQSRILQPPHPGDRMQVVMSWLIPVALFVLFYTMPSAAVLYWFSQTLISIIETLVTVRREAAREAVRAATVTEKTEDDTDTGESE